MPSTGGFTPEHELKKREEVISRLNRQRNTEEVLEAIRRSQLPIFLAAQQVDVTQLDKNELLENWSERDYQYRMLDANERMAEAVEKLLTESRIKGTRKGRIFGNRFLLPASNPLVQIDLVHPENTKNLPAGVWLDLPRLPVAKLHLYNEGPTGNLLFSTNEGADSTKAQTTLVATKDYAMDTQEPVLEFINMRATQDITVNLIVEI